MIDFDILSSDVASSYGGSDLWLSQVEDLMDHCRAPPIPDPSVPHMVDTSMNKGLLRDKICLPTTIATHGDLRHSLVRPMAIEVDFFNPFGRSNDILASEAKFPSESPTPRKRLRETSDGNVAGEGSNSFSCGSSPSVVSRQSGEIDSSFDRAREKNRLNAVKNRARKKEYVASLEETIRNMTLEVQYYKQVAVNTVRESRLPSADVNLAASGRAATQYSENGHGISSKLLELQTSMNAQLQSDGTLDDTLLKYLRGCSVGFAITNPNLPGEPMIFVDGGFVSLTGYTMEELLGKNPKFLQVCLPIINLVCYLICSSRKI